MSEQVDRFLSSLESWKENFEVKSYEINKDSVFSGLVKDIRRKNVDSILQKTKNFYKKDFFELPHPEDERVKTFAFASTHCGHCHFIFMVDEDKKHPWLLVQSGNFVDCLFTSSGVIHSVLGEGSWLPAVSNLTKLINQKKLIERVKDVGTERKKTRGVLISSSRPFHFFYDQLFVLYFLIRTASVNGVFYDEVFWPIEDFHKNAKPFNDDVGDIYIGAKAVGKGVYFKNKALVNKTMRDFEEVLRGKIYNLTKSDAELILVFGISSEKRSWLEQIDGYKNILERLSKIFGSIEVYCDGMTAPIGKDINTSSDNETYERLVKATKHIQNIKVEPIFGLEYPEKCRYYLGSDLAVTAMGSSAIVPIRLTHTHTIQFSNVGMRETVCRADGDFVVLNNDPMYVIQEKSTNQGQAQHASYHIPWQHIFNLTVEVLNKTKGTDIKPLEVPPVEEIAKAYEAQEQSRKKKMMAFSAIENRVKPTDKSPDILREVALSFEHAGDIKTALEIMQKALELRPSGPLIKKKIDEYTQLLQEKGNQP